MQHYSVRTAVAILFLLLAAGYVVTSNGFIWPGLGMVETAVSPSLQLISDITMWQRTRGEQTLATAYPLDLDHDLANIPLVFDSWHGEDVAISDINALIMLDPEQIVERVYTNEIGQFIWLTMIGSRQSRSFHPPTDCYYAAGWQTEAVVQAIPLAKGEVHGMLITAQKVDDEKTVHARQLSYYFYLFPHTQRRADDGVVMFRLTSPIFGTPEETLQLFSSFLRHFFQSNDVPDQPMAFETAVSQPTAGELQLMGYQLSHQTIASNEVVGVDLQWLILEPPTGQYQAILRMRDDTGLIWSENEVPHLYAFNVLPPTNEWAPGETYWDRRELSLLSGTPPGGYDITLSLFDLERMQPLTFFSKQGESLGVERHIGTVTVVSTDVAHTFVPMNLIRTMLPRVGLYLIGFDTAVSEAIPGQSIPITFYWQAGEQASSEEKISLDLVSAEKQIVHAWRLPPVADYYPPQMWQAGERLRGQQMVLLPQGLDSGAYAFAIAGVTVGEINITTPHRLWEEPEMETAVSTTFADIISLVGYSFSRNQLTLVWQAVSQIPENYHVFVHVVDTAGSIITQSDGIPARWQRPTTTWANQEYILDIHTLDLPEDQGGLWLRIGLYQVETGIRLQSGVREFVEIKLPDH
jgi:hypothetical protein